MVGVENVRFHVSQLARPHVLLETNSVRKTDHKTRVVPRVFYTVFYAFGIIYNIVSINLTSCHLQKIRFKPASEDLAPFKFSD